MSYAPGQFTNGPGQYQSMNTPGGEYEFIVAPPGRKLRPDECVTRIRYVKGPPAQYTSRLKRRQLREYGDTVRQARAQLVNPGTGKVDITRRVSHFDNMACYEEDHLTPIKDGGDPRIRGTSGPSRTTIGSAAQS